MKRTLFVLCLVAFAVSVFAAQLFNQPVTINQPDGSEINVLASGDEFHNWLHDNRNYTIIQDKQTGWYTWATNINGNVASSQYIVGQSDPLALGLPVGINLSPAQIREKANRFYGNYPIERNSRAPHFGTINNLVVFIKFSNSPDFNQTMPFYDDMFNTATPGYNSMRNYFEAVSYNQLHISTHFYPIPDSTTIICYVDSHPRQYYMPYSASNTIGYDEYNDDERAAREFALLTAAVNFVSSQVPATLDLDGDDDGDVDNVCFIVQGSTTAWATLLWPHRWSIYNSTAFINGSRVYDFNFQLESFLNSSGNSVLSHEMTHTLGAPDLYRYYDNTIDPVGSWDLMSGNTNPPQSMSAWMKYKYLDWVPTVPTLTQSGTYTINSLWSATNNIYRIPSWRSSEYYVVEYRKPYGIYDTLIPGTGLLVYRLNTNEDGNAGGPPDELYIYRPGGTSTTDNGVVNLAHFSVQEGRTFMNESTVPNGFLSDNMPGGLDISNISASGGETMSFTVNISNVQVTYPKGGETFFGGATKIITWKSRTQVGNAKVEFSPDNGQTWQTITASTPNTGSYTWAGIPAIDSDQCLVKVTTLSNNAVDNCNYTFTILSTIAVPEPVFPQDLMVNAPTNPVFRWNSVQGAESYLLQVALDSEFISNVINMIDLPDTTYAFNNLMPFTQYYWRVAAFSMVSVSDYCPTQQFTTGDISIIPNLPALVVPSNNAINQPMNTLLRWNSGTYAYYYHYQVALDFYFSNVVQENDSLYGTEVRLQPLAANTRYYWRVRSGNPGGCSNFTNIRNFTTGDFITASQDDTSPVVTNLKQNYPNPFNLNTQIEFSLKDANAPAKLTVFNIKGQTVKVLVNGLTKSQVNTFTWDGTNKQGKSVSSGIYYYKLETKGYAQIRKMLLVR